MNIKINYGTGNDLPEGQAKEIIHIEKQFLS